jgi:hypothetical protein
MKPAVVINAPEKTVQLIAGMLKTQEKRSVLLESSLHFLTTRCSMSKDKAKAILGL